jgi:hypothetical protein
LDPDFGISKIKQNSSDMNEIILAPCDAGYVQNCTGYVYAWYQEFDFEFFLNFKQNWQKLKIIRTQRRRKLLREEPPMAHLKITFWNYFF